MNTRISFVSVHKSSFHCEGCSEYFSKGKWKISQFKLHFSFMFLCEFPVLLKMFLTTDDLSIKFSNLQSSFQNDDLVTAADLFDRN